MFQCSTVWISTVSRLTTCHICLNKISVVLPNVERVSKHLQQPCLKFIVQQTPTVSLYPIDTVFILSSCKVSPGQQEAKPTQQLHLEVGRYSSQTHYQPLSHANIPALFTLEWSRRKVERAHGVFEARLGWNGAGKKVEAHVAKSPGLSLFCREELVDGDSDESYALHSYRSTATYAICRGKSGCSSVNEFSSHNEPKWVQLIHRSQKISPSKWPAAGILGPDLVVPSVPSLYLCPKFM